MPVRGPDCAHLEVGFPFLTHLSKTCSLNISCRRSTSPPTSRRTTASGAALDPDARHSRSPTSLRLISGSLRRSRRTPSKSRPRKHLLARSTDRLLFHSSPSISLALADEDAKPKVEDTD